MGLSAHLKHILIVVLMVGGVLAGLAIRGKYEAYVADRMASRDEKIAANQATSAELKKGAQSDQDSITARDAARDKEVAILKAKLSQALTPAQADAIIAARLNGLVITQGKDSQGNATTTVETSKLADNLNKAAITQAICDRNLGTCEADKANLNQAIGKLNGTIVGDENTIKLQSQQITELQKFQVPRWTLMAGVGKAQGTNFNDINNYQPVIGLDYRLSGRIGVFGLAQNKSAAVGLSWRFGATK